MLTPDKDKQKAPAPADGLSLENLVPKPVDRSQNRQIGTELPSDIRELRLKDIESRFGVTESAILTRLTGKPDDVSKNVWRKFQRYLKSPDVILRAIGLVTPAPDPAFAEYHRAIEKQIGSGRMPDYHEGNWDDEINDAVRRAIAQHMKPKRPPVKSEMNPRVSFQPRSDYHGGA